MKKKKSTRYMSRSNRRGRAIDGNDFVAGIRIMGQRKILWFNELLDASGRLDIGRTHQRTIRIRDQAISRLHCEIQRVEPGIYFLRDLNSRNGVKVRVRGHRGEFAELEPGTKVHLLPGIHIKLGNTIIVPVDVNGQCPINARDDKELARLAEETYGSAAAAARVVGRSSRWVRTVAKNLTRMFV